MNAKRMVGLAVTAILLAIGAPQASAAAVQSMRGDDDGFGTGTPVVPGQMVSWPGPADADGFDGFPIGTAAAPDFQWTHTYVPPSPTTGGTLYVQTLDFPESGYGQAALMVDGAMTNLFFPIVPTESGPFTVHGVTFDLAGYAGTLSDGSVTFGIDVGAGDQFSVDFAVLTIVPEPACLSLLASGGLLVLLRRRAARLS